MTKTYKVYLDENYARVVAAEYKKTAKKVTVTCRDGCEWLVTIYN